MGCECPWLSGTSRTRQSTLFPPGFSGLAEPRADGFHSVLAVCLGKSCSPPLQGQACSSQVFEYQQSAENMKHCEHSAGNAGPGAEEQEPTGADCDGNGLPALTDKGLGVPWLGQCSLAVPRLTPSCSALGWQLQEGKLRCARRSLASREAFLSSTPHTESWCLSSQQQKVLGCKCGEKQKKEKKNRICQPTSLSFWGVEITVCLKISPLVTSDWGLAIPNASCCHMKWRWSPGLVSWRNQSSSGKNCSCFSGGHGKSLTP